MNNTIVLKKGFARLTDREYKSFSKGDTIFGNNSNPTEIKRWCMDQEDAAKAELKKYKCSYRYGYLWDIEEFALEYCECDEDGEFVQGSDYDFAEEIEE